MSIGFKKKVVKIGTNPEYAALSDIKKLFYDEAKKEFEEAKLKIAKAIKKSDLSKTSDRKVIPSRVARKVSQRMGKTINHSHASKNSSKFLYHQIENWNFKLESLYQNSDFSSDNFKTKVELKSDYNQLKAEQESIQREVDIKELQLAAKELLIPEQAQLKNKIAELEKQNKALIEEKVNLEHALQTMTMQLAGDMDVQRIKQENIRLRTLLTEHGIKVD
jgi:hypothetical protein